MIQHADLFVPTVKVRSVKARAILFLADCPRSPHHPILRLLMDRKTDMAQNRLSEETSPYLLQHADNPVHWLGWGPQALAQASGADKPILLSVGYAACHWCHVMAHECFENEAIASLMNQHFINIKVDREERPDIDTIYQHALQLLGQQGGWPLTMFLTPDGAPFWGGTYFPPQPRYGRPGFPQILEAISDHWQNNRTKCLETATALGQGLDKVWTPATVAGASTTEAIPLTVNDQVATRLRQRFDMTHGGFGQAPKFPNPSLLELLWRTALRNEDDDLASAVELSLTKMCQGGIYDHLGGGFARYSTDDIWLVPHFEKMLYDNAQLIDLLTWAWQKTRNPLFALRVEETVEWVLREMIAPDGAAFAATYDADSEGEEGKFYVWSEAELIDVLGTGPDSTLFREVYDVTASGNWEGKTILNRTEHPDPLDEASEASLARSRRILYDVRGKRVWPGWDDKVLADWNGLMIAALVLAAQVFQRPHWLAAADAAFRFVRNQMTQNGRLLHSFRNGQLKHSASLDDYANMIRAALALHEAGCGPYLDLARQWLEVADKHYWDDNDGGYYFTADDAEALIVRTKSAADNATPAGNATLVSALARLFHLTGDDSYRLRAEAVLSTFCGDVAQSPIAFAGLLCANEMLQQCTQVVIMGNPETESTRNMLNETWLQPNMNKLITNVQPDVKLPVGHPALGKPPIDDKATVYICRSQTCSLPITGTASLRAALQP